MYFMIFLIHFTLKIYSLKSKNSIRFDAIHFGPLKYATGITIVLHFNMIYLYKYQYISKLLTIMEYIKNN